MVAGAGDDASPRPNLDKSPVSAGDAGRHRVNTRVKVYRPHVIRYIFVCVIASMAAADFKHYSRMAHQSKGCSSGCLLCPSVLSWELQKGCCNNPNE